MRSPTSTLLSVRWSLPLFLAVVAGLAVWRVWLTWRLMEQDRNLAVQRAHDWLEQIADLALAQLTERSTRGTSASANWRLSLPWVRSSRGFR